MRFPVPRRLCSPVIPCDPLSSPVFPCLPCLPPCFPCACPVFALCCCFYLRSQRSPLLWHLRPQAHTPAYRWERHCGASEEWAQWERGHPPRGRPHGSVVSHCSCQPSSVWPDAMCRCCSGCIWHSSHGLLPDPRVARILVLGEPCYPSPCHEPVWQASTFAWWKSSCLQRVVSPRDAPPPPPPFVCAVVNEQRGGLDCDDGVPAGAPRDVPGPQHPHHSPEPDRHC
jgi:hypothetical protein